MRSLARINYKFFLCIVNNMFCMLKKKNPTVFWKLYKKEEVICLFFFFLILGNLYTRQVQIEGETLAIQVQDTPGIQVREMLWILWLNQRESACLGNWHWLFWNFLNCSKREISGIKSRLLHIVWHFNCKSSPALICETDRNFLLGSFSAAGNSIANTLGIGSFLNMVKRI